MWPLKPLCFSDLLVEEVDMVVPKGTEAGISMREPHTYLMRSTVECEVLHMQDIAYVTSHQMLISVVVAQKCQTGHNFKITGEGRQATPRVNLRTW